MDFSFLHHSDQPAEDKAPIDPAALARDMYVQEQKTEWSRAFSNLKQRPVLNCLPLAGFGGKGEADPKPDLFEPDAPPLVKQFNGVERVAFETLDKQARTRIEEIIAAMPEKDRQAYETEAADYQKRMEKYFATGTLLSQPPEYGPTMKAYGKKIDDAIQPLELRKAKIDLQMRHDMGPEFQKQYEEYEKQRRTFT